MQTPLGEVSTDVMRQIDRVVWLAPGSSRTRAWIRLWLGWSMTELDPDVLAYYERGEEAARLRAKNPIEFVRTIQILDRVLPSAPANVLDVGGGPGAYAAWLQEQGYQVELIDPVPLHVEQANQLDATGLAARVGDSRALDVTDETADVVLLMGPLYHLVDADDRSASLRECWRVLRPGGVLVAAAITRWAPLFDLVMREVLSPTDLATWWASTGRTGSQRAADAPGFTTAYFHRPAELVDEIEQAEFTNTELCGVEGVALFLPDHVERMADPRRRALLVAAAEAVEREPALAGLSPHILAIAHKQPQK